jgi:hypothetical protein
VGGRLGPDGSFEIPIHLGPDGSFEIPIHSSSVNHEALEPFCQALLQEIAPTFRVVLRSEETGAVVLGQIDVEVKSVSIVKSGHGFFADEAYYDLFIKATPGVTPITLRQPLKFTTLGTADVDFSILCRLFQH